MQRLHRRSRHCYRRARYDGDVERAVLFHELSEQPGYVASSVVVSDKDIASDRAHLGLRVTSVRREGSVR